MRRIDKSGEPTELQKYRRTKGEPAPTYDDMPPEVSQSLRATLLAEQGWLCCYCMRRISTSDCRIEHWAAKSTYPDKQLDYRNLFAACSGDLGDEPHCDVSKGNQPISINLRTIDAALFRYLNCGSIETDRKEFADDINNILRLNSLGLCHQRKTALLQFWKHIGSPQQAWSKERLQKARNKLTKSDAEGRLRPFFAMLVFWLNKTIARR